MLQEFIDKVVAVTGAANGIGKGCVKAFAKEGAKVVALDIDIKGAEAVAEEFNAEGGKVTAMQVDITDENSVKAVFDRIKAEFGGLDALINCAGIISFDKYDQQDCASWDRVMNVDLRGTYFCCRFAALIMREQKSGAIVNISAGAAKTGGLNPSPSYVSAKGGTNSLTLHMANQLAPYGIRVNCICPGPIDTAMIDAQANLPGAKGDGRASIIAQVPLGLGTPEDIAYGAMFLASPVMARYITGEILDINGGLIKD